MKHIFKKLHIGGGHDPGGRASHEISPSSSSSSSVAAPPSPSCGSDHRRHGGGAAASTSPPSPGEGAASAAARAAAERADYYLSEEEFQVQLALAISASNSEFREDPDNDQIREATLLSLGKQQTDPVWREQNTAEALSRRYLDYNVLDYDVKVADGFYDIFGLSFDPVGHVKMPSLAYLQTNIGDLGFEVIIVNRTIDPTLVELEQIAHIISLDCPSSEIDLVVQRIADLVAGHMGGPVKDANYMLTRWMERSSELRTSLQTSLLAIGSINVGLSRHRALLFKVLADHVGIPCKLVKGSHYTGIDDDAVNMIKLDDREFLIDLMAAPGTLIPADVLGAKDASLNLNNPQAKNQASQKANDSGSAWPWIESCCSDDSGVGKSATECSGIVGGTSWSEKAGVVSSFPNASNDELPSCSESSSSGQMSNLILAGNPYQFLPSTSASSREGDLEVSLLSGGVKEKLHSSHLQDVDSGNLFAELNPFQIAGVGKYPSQFNKTTETVKNGLRLRENIVSGPGRPPLPLVWKNRSTCNEVSDKEYDLTEGPFPQKNVRLKDAKTSSPSISASSEQIKTEVPKSNMLGISGVPYPARNCTDGTSMVTGSHFSSGEELQKDPSINQFHTTKDYDKTDELVKILSSEKQHQGKGVDAGMIQHNMVGGPNVAKSAGDTEDNIKYTNDGLLDSRLLLKDPGSSSITVQTGMPRVDPMLDDVAECEVPWEDLVIGERIGLGSYGEVYRADWNGTEVAVKKFLDQDFSGDALDEFRREVRIMRRLRHPNVVLFMGAVTRPPSLSIVTEFLPRGSLYRILHRSDCKIDEKRRIKMALDVAKGMNCLHTSTPIIVHRDLKSPNLLVDKNWNVKVCDFGLSRLKHNTFLSSKSTAGTPEWMAPEVLRNEPSNEKCDVYSFGIILWELTMLKMPWSGMNPMQVVGAVGFQNRRLDIPKEVDPLVAQIIWQCWQTDPSLRPSFAQLTSVLKPLQQLVVPSHEDSHSPPMPQEISVNSSTLESFYNCV